jgi:Flp pilus assembly protein TadG
MPTWNPPFARSATLARRLRQERGQALVEFAVVLPVLMLIVMGIIFFGRYESYSTQMTQLAEVGARDAAVGVVATSANGGTCSGATATANLACYIQNQATGELAGGSQDVQKLGVRVDCTGTSGQCTSGSNVIVCTQAVVQFPFLPVKAGTIFQKATMRVESQAATPLVDSVTPDANPPSC